MKRLTVLGFSLLWLAPVFASHPVRSFKMSENTAGWWSAQPHSGELLTGQEEPTRPGKADLERDRKIQGFISQLGDNTLARRDEAQKELEQIPEAEPHLKEYLSRTEGKNPEIESRAKAVLHAFDVRRHGRIAFRQNEAIWVMDYEGCHARAVTQKKDHGSPLGSPVWSPDGQKIAFMCKESDSNDDIYAVEVSTGKLTRLTAHAARDREPTWSPDGRKLVFESERDEKVNLYSIDADGKNLVRLTDPESSSFSPQWSPDGRKIAFRSDRDSGWEIFIMDPDGKNPVQVTREGKLAGEIAWSPDSRRLAFTLDRSRMRTDGEGLQYDPDTDIYVIGADGKNQVRLTEDQKYRKSSLAWSPDGTQVVFDAATDSGWLGICVVGVESRQRRTLAWTREVRYSSPQFSPDGKTIVFLEDPAQGKDSICVMEPDGKNVKRLISGEVLHPVWSPAPKSGR